MIRFIEERLEIYKFATIKIKRLVEYLPACKYEISIDVSYPDAETNTFTSSSYLCIICSRDEALELISKFISTDNMGYDKIKKILNFIKTTNVFGQSIEENRAAIPPPPCQSQSDIVSKW